MSALPLKVMSFNLRRRKVSDGVNTWAARRESAVEVVRRYAPDVCGTQEGLLDQVDDLRRGLPEYAVLGQGRFGGSDDEHNAIFYRRDRLRAIDHGDFWLSDTPDRAGSRSWGNLVPRMCTWARFEERGTGHPVWIYNTHFDHLVPRARRRAAELVSQRFPDGRDNVIMMGDLNAVAGGFTHRYLTKYAKGPMLVDTLPEAEETNSRRWNATFHKFTGRGLYRIDYLLLKHESRVKRHVVVRDAPNGKLPSDHFPVFAEIEMPVL